MRTPVLLLPWLAAVNKLIALATPQVVKLQHKMFYEMQQCLCSSHTQAPAKATPWSYKHVNMHHKLLFYRALHAFAVMHVYQLLLQRQDAGAGTYVSKHLEATVPHNIHHRCQHIYPTETYPQLQHVVLPASKQNTSWQALSFPLGFCCSGHLTCLSSPASTTHSVQRCDHVLQTARHPGFTRSALGGV